MTQALVIVDVQNDFCEGGLLAVTGGAAVAASISEFMERTGGDFEAIVTTQDWHIDPRGHFSQTPDYATTWPVHCLAGEPGAELHPELETEDVDAGFLKGLYDDGYSGFEARLGEAERVGILQGEKGTRVEPADVIDDDAPDLDSWLRDQGIEHLVITGIATDHCVLATASDALDNGYTVTILRDLTVGVAETSVAEALERLEDAGARIIDSEDF